VTPRSERPLSVSAEASRSEPGGAWGVLGEVEPRAGVLGWYVHVPFCTKRCGYCSFATAPADAVMERRYLAALTREIELLGRLPWAGRLVVGSIFFGGGTPSLLAADDLVAILEAMRAGFRVAPDAEITVECNPESVDRAKLAGYRAAGVSRISLGVQSLDDAILPRLDRLHTAADARRAFEAAREAGHDDVSVDLMYGLPGLDAGVWARTVDAVLGWGPEHLSAYGLTLDEGSLWTAGGVRGLPPEDEIVAQYWTLARAAAARGYEHYEVSNYARPGHRARHNQGYWRAEEYLASGPAACGFVGDARYGNARAVTRYCAALEAGALPIEAAERLEGRQRRAERLILGLRTADGVPRALLDERVAGDPVLARRLEAWRAEGLLADAGERARLTERGFLLSDALFVELL
jgi:oxygen-independent coproporphyrinogen-3 oxidase